MPRALPIAIALALVIAAGLVHGRWTQCWATSPAVEVALARLERVPVTLGDWWGRPLELDREQLTMAEIAGYIARRYENRRNGAAVTVLLVCGRPGPISVHTPDICYVGAGYEPMGPLARQSLPIGSSGQPAEFWHAVFGKPTSTVPTYLRILWSWSAVGLWEAPGKPRLVFAPRLVLFKIYVIREIETAEERLEDDPILEFLQTLLPELERALFANP